MPYIWLNRTEQTRLGRKAGLFSFLEAGQEEGEEEKVAEAQINLTLTKRIASSD